MDQARRAAQEDAGAVPAVRPFAVGDAAAWEGFVAAAPAATFFHALAWRRVVEREPGPSLPLPLRLARRSAGRHPAARSCPLAGCSAPPLISTGVRRLWRHRRRRRGGGAGARGGCGGAGRELGVDYVELRQLQPAPIGWRAKADLYFTFCRTSRAVARGQSQGDSAQEARRSAQGDRQPRAAGRGRRRFRDVLPHLCRELAQSRHAGVAAALLCRDRRGIRRGGRAVGGARAGRAGCRADDVLFQGPGHALLRRRDRRRRGRSTPTTCSTGA